jgi:hypothetical protein|tara:strand:+ start:214 stop:378 length:165 start_codon:yes stop_codon:yes gene_type:complete
MNWLTKTLGKIGIIKTEEVRARDDKGRYVADDPSTAKNEAYKTVRVKRSKTKKS